VASDVAKLMSIWNKGPRAILNVQSFAAGVSEDQNLGCPDLKRDRQDFRIEREIRVSCDMPSHVFPRSLAFRGHGAWPVNLQALGLSAPRSRSVSRLAKY
jgi:hypothetical protein